MKISELPQFFSYFHVELNEHITLEKRHTMHDGEISAVYPDLYQEFTTV